MHLIDWRVFRAMARDGARGATNPFLRPLASPPPLFEPPSPMRVEDGEEGSSRPVRLEECIDGASWLESGSHSYSHESIHDGPHGQDGKRKGNRKDGKIKDLESLLSYSNQRRARRSVEDIREVILCQSDDDERDTKQRKENDHVPERGVETICDVSQTEEAEKSGAETWKDVKRTFVVHVRRAWLGAYHTGACRAEFQTKGLQVECGKDSELNTFVKIEDVERFGVHYTPQMDASCAQQDKEALVVLHLREAPANLRKVLDLNSTSLLNRTIVLETGNKEYVEVQREMLTKLIGWQKLWSPVKELEALEVVARLENQRKMDTGLKVTLANDFYYPSRTERDAVNITNRDLRRLRPTEFLNDTIIDFYIKYLQRSLKGTLTGRFHFFSSFFYKRLVTAGKGGAFDDRKRRAYEQVQNWTKDVDIFEKDYLVIPVNDALHWSLVIVCNPGAIVDTVLQVRKEKEPLVINDDDDGDEVLVMEKEQAIDHVRHRTCILHFDSMNGKHGDIDAVRAYLEFEWTNKRAADEKNSVAVSFDKEFVSLLKCDVPQQTNFCDCGLFLLHYLELFLKEAPAKFSHPSQDGPPSFLAPSWFEPTEASRKRSTIRDLLVSLSENEYRSEGPGESEGLSNAEENPDEVEIQCMEDVPPAAVHKEIEPPSENALDVTATPSATPSPSSRGIMAWLHRSTPPEKQPEALRKQKAVPNMVVHD